MSKRELKKRIIELEQRVAELEARPLIQTVPYQRYWPSYTATVPGWPNYSITCASDSGVLSGKIA